MGFRGSIIAFTAVAAMLVGPTAAEASNFLNGSFEENLDGWTTDPSLVTVPPVFFHRDANGDPDFKFDPIDGYVFAALQADATDTPVLLSQTFTTKTGGRFSGAAAFLAEDDAPRNDSAYVRIFDANTSKLLFASDIAAVGDYGFTHWRRFGAVLGPGEYTIEAGVKNTVEAGVKNTVDGFNPSLLLVDDFRFSVPEPSAWALMIIGLGGIGTMLRFRRRLPA